MRDVNAVALIIAYTIFTRFIWTMRDVNLAAAVNMQTNELCFIWTMRDVNLFDFWIFSFILEFYLNYEGCKRWVSQTRWLEPARFIWTMRDVNIFVWLEGGIMKMGFIWTMRDVNSSKIHGSRGLFICFIWTMRDVNCLYNWIGFKSYSVLSELWGM